MAYPYSICPTDSSATIVNGIYYYPAEHCLFHQPAQLMSEVPITTFGCSAGNSACQSASLKAAESPHARDEWLSPRIDSAGFRVGSRLPSEGLKVCGGQTPCSCEPKFSRSREEAWILPMFQRDYRVPLPAGGHFRYKIRVYFCALRCKIDNPKHIMAIRGIGHEINQQILGDEPELRPWFIAPGEQYADMVVEGHEHIPIDVLTFNPLRPE